MSIWAKIKWVVAIVLVFIIVLTTNLIDKDNFNSLKKSIVTIYEDRLVAKDLIFDLSQIVHEKELAFVQQDSAFFLSSSEETSSEIEAIIGQYEQTQLTQEERNLFNGLKQNLQQLTDIERGNAKAILANASYADYLNRAKVSLRNLAKVQLKEGKRQKKLSEKNIRTIELFTQIEIIFLVILAVIFQIIVLYTPSKKSN